MFLSQIWDILTLLNFWIPINSIWCSPSITFCITSLPPATPVSVDTRDHFSYNVQLTKRSTRQHFDLILRKNTSLLQGAMVATIALIWLTSRLQCIWWLLIVCKWNIFFCNFNCDDQIIGETEIEELTDKHPMTHLLHCYLFVWNCVKKNMTVWQFLVHNNTNITFLEISIYCVWHGSQDAF